MSKKTYKEIVKALPEISSPNVEDLADAIDDVIAIKNLFQSDGGKLLIEKLRTNCSHAITKAIYYAKNGLPDLVVISVLDYSANIDLLSKLQDISMEKELREQLDELVKDEYARLS